MRKDKYYVTNPNGIEIWVEDNLVPEFAVSKPIRISFDKAVELKNSGWTIVRQDADVEKGTAPSIGGSIPLSRIMDEDENAHLNLEDANKYILCENSMTVYVPRDNDVNFDNGAVITIVVLNETVGVVRNSYDDDDDSQARVDCSGIGTDSFWILQPNTINTIMKIKPNHWMLAGPGIEED